MTKPTVLLQLDSDVHASSFDAVVAVDSGVAYLLPYSNVTVERVRNLVHGAIFTRGPKELSRTAVFVGGADVRSGEALFREVQAAFIGPLRVSVMLDANGANTTAAAAVLAAARHVQLAGSQFLVLAATGPVGQRVVRLLARAGAVVRVASRSLGRAKSLCHHTAERVPNAVLVPCGTDSAEATQKALADTDVLISAGAAGVQLVPGEMLRAATGLRVAIDLNAVPPLGIEGIGVTDEARESEGLVRYGAVGVGGTKMKIHKAALRRLFTSNDQVLDAEEIYQLGVDLERAE